MRSGMVISLILSVPCLVSAVMGQSNQLVVPPGLADSEGNQVANLTRPYPDVPPCCDTSTPDGFRTQELFYATDFSSMEPGPLVISGLAWRPDGSVDAAIHREYIYDVWLGTTPVQSLSEKRAANYGIGAAALVFSGTARFETDGVPRPDGLPHDFDYVIEFDTPYVYDPAEGNLLVEMASPHDHLGDPIWRDFHTASPEQTRLQFFANQVNPDVAVAQGTGVSVTQFTVFPEPSVWLRGLGILTDLPFNPFYSHATAVSADGLVVVGFSGDAFHDWPFRWTSETNIVTLEVLNPLGQYYSPNAVTSDGSVIVGGGDSGAFHWTAETGMVELGDGEAFAVSGDGNVVVGTSGSRAFRWTEESGMVAIGDQGTTARGISSDGSVIVGHAWEGEAFRWTPETGIVDLGSLPGGEKSQALAVSADGRVIVGAAEIDDDGGTQAFRWTEENGMVALGQLSGIVSAEARAVSADGSVVVGVGHRLPTHPLAPWDREAIIWNAQGEARSLQDVLVNDYDLDLTDWQLAAATGISADGTVIVGWGRSPRSGEAWMVTIPEPSGGILCLLGLCFAACSFRSFVRYVHMPPTEGVSVRWHGNHYAGDILWNWHSAEHVGAYEGWRMASRLSDDAAAVTFHGSVPLLTDLEANE